MPVARHLEIDRQHSPPWGELRGERYLLRMWDHSSPESPEAQRIRLVRRYAFEVAAQLSWDAWIFVNGVYHGPEPLAPPTEREVNTVLRPWRSEEARLCAPQDETSLLSEPTILRTHYDDEDAEAWEELLRYAQDQSPDDLLIDDGTVMVLDDPALFASRDGDDEAPDGWRRVFDVLPELSSKIERSSSHASPPLGDGEGEGGVADQARFAIENAVRRFLRSREESYAPQPREILRRYENMGAAEAAECFVRHEMQLESLITYLVLADAETFRPSQVEERTFRVLFLDSRSNVIRHTRFSAGDLGSMRDGFYRRCRALSYDLYWEEGEVGRKYLPDGEIGRELYPRGMEAIELEFVRDGLGALRVE